METKTRPPTAEVLLWEEVDNASVWEPERQCRAILIKIQKPRQRDLGIRALVIAENR